MFWEVKEALCSSCASRRILLFRHVLGVFHLDTSKETGFYNVLEVIVFVRHGIYPHENLSPGVAVRLPRSYGVKAALATAEVKLHDPSFVDRWNCLLSPQEIRALRISRALWS